MGKGKVKARIFITAGILVEVGAVCGFLRGPFPLAFLAHLGSSGMFGLGMWKAWGRPWGMLGGLTCFLFPVVGIPAALAMQRIRSSGPKGDVIGEYHKYINSIRFHQGHFGAKLTQMDAQRMAEEVKMEALEVEPVSYLLESPDASLKRIAVELLVRMRSPDSVRVLKRVLKDDNPEVRFYAQVGLAKVEEEFLAAIDRAEKALSDAEDRGKALIELGDRYLEYCMSGLLEGELWEHYLKLAEGVYKKAWETTPGPDTAFRLGRVLLLRGRDDEAEKIVEGASSPELFLLRAELAYRRGDIEGVRRWCREAIAVGLKEGEGREVAEFWAGVEPIL